MKQYRIFSFDCNINFDIRLCHLIKQREIVKKQRFLLYTNQIKAVHLSNKDK